MAQLLDARTSELIAEGTPLEVVLIADELGRDEVLFDGVGLGFDPTAVTKAEKERLAGLKDVDAKAHKAALAEHDAIKKRAPAAQKLLERARKRVE